MSQNAGLKEDFNIVILYLSIVSIVNVQPGSRKPYTKHFLMSTKGFFLCCYRIFTLSGMPQLGAALKIYQQYFFDICHTHFSTAPFQQRIFMNHLLKIYLMCQRHGDNGNLTDFWICYSDETRQYAETSPSTYRKGHGMIQLNSICITTTWLFYIIK